MRLQRGLYGQSSGRIVRTEFREDCTDMDFREDCTDRVQGGLYGQTSGRIVRTDFKEDCTDRLQGRLYGQTSGTTVRTDFRDDCTDIYRLLNYIHGSSLFFCQLIKICIQGKNHLVINAEVKVVIRVSFFVGHPVVFTIVQISPCSIHSRPDITL